MNYALVGYGRMGRAIEKAAGEHGHRCVAVFDPAREPARALDSEALGGVDVAFEFTLPGEAEANVRALVGHGVATVCGTTGWKLTPAFCDAVARAPAGLVLAPNFSVGMNLFFRLVGQAAVLFGPPGSFEPYVEEAHHRGKRDVPSGTARSIAEILLGADPRLEGVLEGNPDGALADGVLQVVSRRAGTEMGTHTVGFDGEHEQIVLRHRARGREGLALGAILAAEWIRGRLGRHGFDEVLDDYLSRGRGGAGGILEA